MIRHISNIVESIFEFKILTLNHSYSKFKPIKKNQFYYLNKVEYIINVLIPSKA
jgi:hypothetical protein